MKSETPLTLVLRSKAGDDRLQGLAQLVCEQDGEILPLDLDIDPSEADAASRAAEIIRSDIGGGRPQHLLTEWSDEPNVIGFHAILARELGVAAIVARLRECCHFHRIVLATGGGGHSLQGLKLGKRLAESLDVDATVVRVIRPGAQAEDPQRLRLHTQQVHSALEMQCRVLGIRAPLVVKIGEDVAGAIIEETRDDDLVVIGGTNDWRVRKHLQGSIPDEVAHRANCSVIMHFSPPRRELALNDVFWERTTVPNLHTPEKWSAISTLIDTLVADKQIPVAERDTILKTVIEREKAEATCAGRGIAIPHAPMPGFRGTVGALGLCREGIPDWGNQTDPVQLIFLLVTPVDDYGDYLGVLSRIARIVSDETAKQRLLNAQTAADLMITMEEFEGSSIDG